MAVLITGGSGFVGLNLAEQLLLAGEEVVLFALAPPPQVALDHFARLPGTVRVIEGDILDASELDAAFSAARITRLMHGAVITSAAGRERRDPERIVEVNLVGTLRALEAARHRAVERFLYLSSGAVYGDNAFDREALDEGADLPVPDTLYAITKYAAERTSLRYGELWGMDVRAARLGSVFGRWEYDTGLRDTLSAPLQATRLAKEGGTAVLPRAGLRDWIYGPDVARALVALLDLERPRYAVYNVGPGRRWSLADWCRRLQEVYPRFIYRIAEEGESASVDLYGPRDRAPLSVRRLFEETGFRPRYDLDDAFADFVAWRKMRPL